MARDGSGTYNLLVNSWNPAINAVSATAADWQSLINDIASAMTQSVSKDGQTTMTGNLKMGSFKITGLANGTSTTDGAAYGQIQQWLASGLTPTYVSGTQFTLVGDQTTEFHVGRKVKFTVTAGTVYGKITASSYAALTTVTVVNDSGALDSGLSAVEYSILKADNSAIPHTKSASTGITFTTNTSMSGAQFRMAKGADIASATTVDLTAATGNTVHITGTTTTTGVTLNSGTWVLCIADAAWPLTYHATTMKLNTGGANYTCAAGDRILFYYDGTTTFGNITKQTGTEVISSSKVVQIVNSSTSAVATGTTTVPRDDTIPQNTEGDQYLSLAITPSSASTILRITVSVFAANTAGGGTFIMSLFQDSTSNALATTSQYFANTGTTTNINFQHYMTSGTTSATTFKIRLGSDQVGTTTLNGSGGARLFGGVASSSITIQEITP